MTDQPIGAIVDTSPAARPAAVTLEGRFARLGKLDSAAHGEALWRAIENDDSLWTYMGYGPFAGEAEFRRWLAERAALDDPFSYAVIDKASGHEVGIVTLMETRPGARVIEIGNIVYTRELQRKPAGTEAQYLAMRYAFEDLGYRRYEWKCNDLNAPSRRAAERYGFRYEGTFRQHMIIKGRNRDTAWYAILDSEWPAVKAAFEQWLEPANFDAAGNQKKSLATFQKEQK